MINWVLFYTAQFFIAIGILVYLLKPAKAKIDPRYRAMAILSAVILFLSFAIPNLEPALNFTRFYAISLLFLAPCFVSGGATLVGISKNAFRRITGRRPLSNRNNQVGTVLLCAVVLVGYFISQSGFINCTTVASPLSYSLDYNRIRNSNDPNSLNSITFCTVYIPEQDAYGAIWLSKNKAESSMVYADYVSGSNVLGSYGLIPRQQVVWLPHRTMLEQGNLVYLGQINLNGIMTTAGESFNASLIYPLISKTSLVYSNGNCQIWYVSSQSQIDYYD
jgi:uncharacterized membrane protein